MDPTDPASPRPAAPDGDPELVRLRRELDAERARAESLAASLRLQALRGDGLQAGLDGARHRLHQIETSHAWRMTRSLRYARALAAGRLPSGHGFREAAGALRTIYGDEGVGAAARQSWQFVRPLVPRLPRLRLPKRRPPVPSSSAPAPAPASAPAAVGAGSGPVPAAQHPYEAAPRPIPGLLAPSVLIVAELSVPQCAKYRVWQKQEMLRGLGRECRVVSWREIDHVFTALQFCTELVFYRVPAEPVVLAMIAEARRLGLSPWWEVDDLIFDPVLYRRNSNLRTLDPALRREVLRGSALYRQAMLACDRAIASTATLAAAMREAGVAHAAVIENALDAETLEIADRLRSLRGIGDAPGAEPVEAAADRPVTIVYGSGTKTHDADFAEAAPAILALLRRHPRLRLRIVGELTLPAGFAAFPDRVEEIGPTNYRAYLGLLAAADIAIAPLEDTVFNDAKSNIKFQEAAMLALPSVCSPRATFRDVVRDGENGLLATDAASWERALEALVVDPALRRRLGERARRDVLDRYAPERVAAEQVRPVLGGAGEGARDRTKLRVLAANIFFAPQSFGGATIVAEELASRLAADRGTEVVVFTSRPAIPDRPASILRFDARGLPVFATTLSSPSDQVVQLDNPSIGDGFGLLLDAVRPDVVHAHSIQGFGVAILRACRERGIPYVVTLHDAWWLCDRQFMVRGDNRYCFQERIDLRVCQNCLPHARHLPERARIMAGALEGAAALLSPSASHRTLYLANDVPPEKIAVNRNGIRPPSRSRAPRVPGSPVRFGFVAGNEAIKGFHLIQKVFERLESPDWELVLVDNTLNLGFRSLHVDHWETAGTVTVIPAYDQDGVDGFFDRIDVLLFPSQWKESYGLTVREALARNVWVIATAPGGQAEDIVDGINGRLIPLDGRAEALFRAVEEALAEPGRFDDYRNPHADALATYDRQAAELLGILRAAAGTAIPAPDAFLLSAGAASAAPPAGPR
ncbi:MAG: glycosyltransferase [Gluconacetobacter diazotrophicus]|nr:glycosyltransferase [Gluconacetobacter diazotrophicus]